MAKITNQKTIIRLCEGSYQLVKQGKIKGEYYLKNKDGFLAIIINSKGIKERQCEDIEDCKRFFI